MPDPSRVASDSSRGRRRIGLRLRREREVDLARRAAVVAGQREPLWRRAVEPDGGGGGGGSHRMAVARRRASCWVWMRLLVRAEREPRGRNVLS